MLNILWTKSVPVPVFVKEKDMLTLGIIFLIVCCAFFFFCGVFIANEKGNISYPAAVLIIFGLISGLFVPMFFTTSGNGISAGPYFLDKEMIYRFDGQVESVEGKVIAIIEDAVGDTICVKITELLPPETFFVRRAEKEGRIILEPVEVGSRKVDSAQTESEKEEAKPKFVESDSAEPEQK